MRVAVVAVGRLRPAYREAADDYLRRLRRLLPVTEREVREAGRAGNPLATRREEARRLREAAGRGDLLVALTRTGSGWSSEELARRVDRWRTGGRDVSLLIGGSTGLADDLVADADHRWSLGPLTLPHELARVVVLEQLYRAAAILKGLPYHTGG